MALRLIGLAVFLIGLVYLCGCATLVNVFPDELNARQQEKFVRAAVPATISGLMLVLIDSSAGGAQDSVTDSSDTAVTRAKIILFDSLGGKLDSKKGIVSGVARDSTFIEVALENIRYVKVAGIDNYGQYTTLKELEESRDKAKEGPREKTSLAGSPYWDLFSFDEYGGHYDPAREIIVGTSKQGRRVEIAREQVHLLQYKIYDPYKNLRLGVGVAGLVLFSLGIITVF